MKLLIGLGNPGPQFKRTRHNVGQMVIDKFSKFELPEVIAKKTDTFVNDSGVFVKKIMQKYGAIPGELYVVHDDLDIPLGKYKIQFGVGPKNHNGMKSINEAIETDKYWHVRVGIDNRAKEDRQSGEEYVLQDFSDDEKKILEKTVKELCKKLETSFKNIS